MIEKMELTECFSDLDISFVIIDLLNKNIKYFRNDEMKKNDFFNISVEEFNDFIKKYITYWENEYVDNSVIDGNSAQLKIYTNDEVIEYQFKNKYPYNYDNFIKLLKERVGIL